MSCYVVSLCFSKPSDSVCLREELSLDVMLVSLCFSTPSDIVFLLEGLRLDVRIVSLSLSVSARHVIVCVYMRGLG
jgi:hypothetical protein